MIRESLVLSNMEGVIHGYAKREVFETFLKKWMRTDLKDKPSTKVDAPNFGRTVVEARSNGGERYD